MNERKPIHLDLFSGIGGFSLAFEADGFRTVGFSEVDPNKCIVLNHHWPHVPNLGDIKEITRGLVDGCVNLRDVVDMPNKYELEPKYDTAPALYESGLSIQDVADYFNITRQAMWKILKRRGVKFRTQTRTGDANHFYRGGVRHDKRAQHLVEKAIKKGVLVPGACEVCGRTKSAQAHHDDYSKPLNVRWLCKRHHHEWHKKNKAKNGKEATTRTLPVRRIDVLTGGVP